MSEVFMEVFTDEELLTYDGVTEATLENLFHNRGDEEYGMDEQQSC